MNVHLILPALTEATSPYYRPIKYALFPPLGLATLAGYLDADDQITIHDEHVEALDLSDTPDLVIIQVYITNAKRAYQIADHYRKRGCFVCLGGLHTTALPEEALPHADAIFLGPGEDTFPAFLQDWKRKTPKKIYQSTRRTLLDMPATRRDLIKRKLYLVPNVMVVSRGCPHHCAFCYKDAFFKNGKSFYTQAVDRVLAEIDALPGKHLYFLDDNLMGDLRFFTALMDGMQGMGRVWQASGTLSAILTPEVIKKAAQSGLGSLFVGFETLNPTALKLQHKYQNLNRNYNTAINLLHEHGVMINGSFIFGLDEDDETVFSRTVDWAIQKGLETATFHILTPYPGTALFSQMQAQNRISSFDWEKYDTRHVVYKPTSISTQALQDGYWQAYRDFYSWKSIFKASRQHTKKMDQLRHLIYTSGWKKFEPLWDFVVRSHFLPNFRYLLEKLLDGNTDKQNCSQPTAPHVLEQTT